MMIAIFHWHGKVQSDYYRYFLQTTEENVIDKIYIFSN